MAVASSPFKWNVTVSANVTTGSAAGADGPYDSQAFRDGDAHAAGVVEMPVGVEQKAHRLVRNRLDRGQYARRQRRKLVVDQEHAVLADRYTDVAAFAFEHVDVLRQLGGLDLHLVEAVRLGSGRQAEQNGQDDKGEFHDVSRLNGLVEPRHAKLHRIFTTLTIIV